MNTRNVILSLAAVITVSAVGYYLYNETQSATAEPSGEKEGTPTVSYRAITCPSGTSDAGYDIKGQAVCEISNIITNDLTLSNDRLWRIKGEVQIGGDNAQSAILTIEPGTTLFGKSGKDFLVINRGSKIMATGTPSKPIIFTSENDIKGKKAASGEWAGLVIAGNAPINTGNTDEPFEFSKNKIRFGGSNPHDDSGILKYVIVKYAGDEVLPQKELNGISFGGVGDGTIVDYVEVYRGKDDGIELWGGTVNLKHVLLLGNEDDAFDTDFGYRGNVQYLYAEQTKLEASQFGNGIEADNYKKNMGAQPVSHPVLANFEFVGAEGSKYGILFRRGTGYTLVNGSVTGFDVAQFAIHDKQTLVNNEINLISVAFDGSKEAGDLYHGKNGVTKNDVATVVENGKFCQTNAIKTTPSDVRKVTGDSFFESARYIGAFKKGEDWRTGWSVGLN